MDVQVKTTVLNEIDSRNILKKYYIEQNKTVFARNLDEVVMAANNIGYPIVLKVVSDKIVHKTDFGGVHINLNNEDDVKEAYSAIYRNALSNGVPAGEINGISVQKMEAGIEELIIGAKRDEVFGPVIVVGHGGVLVELMNDTALGITPLSKENVIAMLSKLKGYPLLDGYRGRQKTDIQSIVTMVMKVQKLMMSQPEILEIDLNPIIVKEINKGSVAVDARIVTIK